MDRHWIAVPSICFALWVVSWAIVGPVPIVLRGFAAGAVWSAVLICVFVSILNRVPGRRALGQEKT